METEPKGKKNVPAEDCPGVAIDMADDEKVTKEEVKEDIRNLNDNPRNNDL